MFSLTLKTIRAKKARFVLTAVAVMLGVAFMAGTLVLTDTIKQTYDDLAGQVYKDTDAVVRSASTVEADGVTTRGSIDAALLDQVRAVPGVASAEPEVHGVALVVGHDGELLDSSRNRKIPIGMAWPPDERLNPMQLVDGAAPAAANEVVIDSASADKGGFAVGDTITVIGKTGSAEYRLAGIATYAGKDDAAGAQVVAFDAGTASTVLGEAGRYDGIGVVAAPGVSQAALVSKVQTAIADPDVDVITGVAAVSEARTASGSQLAFLNTFLMTFAIVALLVGSFVIYNTFSITVAQRSKETALLRAIGAKRKQVLRSVMFESIITGVFASAIGVAAGVFTAKGIALAFESFGFDLPAGGTVVNSSTIVISMVVGTVVTVLAAYVPARRAAKVAPIAAMRDVSVDRTGTSARRAVIGTVVTVAGAVLIAMGLSGGAIPPVGLGALFVFVGVAVLGPVIARPFTKVLGVPLRLRGIAGTVARQNAARNPRRSAATASALMIGVGLVAFITVFAASTKASINASVDNSVRSDWVVETAWGMGGLSPDATQALDALPETATVTPLRYAPVQVDGSGVDIAAFDPARLADSVDLHARQGDLTNLGPNDLAVWQVTAEQEGLAVGDTVQMKFADTGEQTFTVRSIFDEEGPTAGYAISLAAFDANVADHVDNYVLIDASPGYSSEQVRHALETTLDPYPNADVLTRDEYKGTVAAQIDQMLNLVYVLLFMALVIALFGIANTLALSVFERTREIGLLRAVGMSRSQLRASVRWESVLIAMLGTVLGTAIGLGFGYAMVQALKDQGIGTLAIPTTQLGFVAVLAACAAVLAAALPAYRASRLDVLDSVKGGTD